MKQYTDRFYQYLSDLNRNYEKLALLLEEKISAVDADDVLKLNEIINEEQAHVMISRGFDQNIAGHRERLGLRGDSLGEVIEELPEHERPRFRAVHSQLRTSLEVVRELNEKCQSMTEVKLHSLETRMKAAAKPSAPPPPAPKKKPPAPGSFSKSI